MSDRLVIITFIVTVPTSEGKLVAQSLDLVLSKVLPSDHSDFCYIPALLSTLLGFKFCITQWL